MSTNGVSNNVVSLAQAQTNNSTVKSTNSKSLTADDFLMLMLEQLANQNPMEPLSESEMMTQMTQMNSSSLMEKMNTSLADLLSTNQKLSAASMMGKMVSYLDKEGKTVEGYVSAVEFDDSDVLLDLGNGKQLPLSDVTGVWERSTSNV